MKIATWNVNSIKARLPLVQKWLEIQQPDIICLQELKCVDEAFPMSEIEDLGYNVAVHGQKTYNGVAILSKLPFDEVITGLPVYEGLGEEDEQARYVEVVVTHNDTALRVASIYLPNGNPVDDPKKYGYKLDWMERLYAHAKTLLSYEEPLVLAGDYNIIPTDDDVWNPEAWAEDALFRPQSRAAFTKILNLGLTESYSAADGRAHQYSFWDYTKGSWPKDHGIRIDHLLLSSQAADKLQACEIDRLPRGWERPSDHVPVFIKLEI